MFEGQELLRCSTLVLGISAHQEWSNMMEHTSWCKLHLFDFLSEAALQILKNEASIVASQYI